MGSFYLLQMNGRQWIAQSRHYLHTHPELGSVRFSAHPFRDGGAWLQQCNMSLDGIETDHQLPPDFRFYGRLKYGISGMVTLIFISCCIALLTPAIFFAPLVFYLAEVHFLFLFPVLIHRRSRPLIHTIRLTYKAGFIRSIISTMYIAAYMLSGLCHARKPLRRWHTGCLAVLIWYRHEAGIGIR